MEQIVKHFANYLIEIFKRWDSKETACRNDGVAYTLIMHW